MTLRLIELVFENWGIADGEYKLLWRFAQTFTVLDTGPCCIVLVR